MSGTQQLYLLTLIDAVTVLEREDEEIRVKKTLAVNFIIDVGFGSSFESFVYILLKLKDIEIKFMRIVTSSQAISSNDYFVPYD